MVRAKQRRIVKIWENAKKFILWCDKAMAFSFYVLIFFIPISIALSETFTGTAFFFYLLKRGAMFYGLLKDKDQKPNTVSTFFRKFGKAFKPVPNGLNVPIALIIAISLVSVAKSEYLLLSVEGFVGKVLQNVFLYFNMIECMNSKKRLKTFMNVFLMSFMLICINGLYQSIVGQGFIYGHVFDGRISSSLRHANDFAAYLIVVVPILFCLVFLTGIRKQGDTTKIDEFTCLAQYKGKLICLIPFLLGFICLGLTLSRGAWLGFICSLVFMGLFGLRSRKVIISNGLLIVFFLAIFYPGMPYMKIPFKGASSAKTTSVVKEAPSEAELHKKEFMRQMYGDRFHIINLQTFLVQNNRLGYWQRSFRIIKDYPIFGCGLNTYAQIGGRYTVGWGGYPHNSYLQITAETGLVGVTIFLWMLFVFFRDSLKALSVMAVPVNKMLFFRFFDWVTRIFNT